MPAAPSRPQWPPYFKWRGGRPRWEPGPRLRRKGWKGRDLKDDAGQWLDLAGAISAADAINREVRHGVRPRDPVGTRKARTCRQLYERWQASPEFRMLRASTQEHYRNKAEVFLATQIDGGPETWGDAPVAALGRAALKGYWRACHEARGHAMANAVLAVVRAMLTFATDLEWIAINPGFKLKLPGVPPRQVLWLPDECAAFVAAADRLGLAAIGDAFVVALHSGQRQGDVLALPAHLFGETRIRLSQLKRKARIDAPMTPTLRARLAAIRARRSDTTVVPLATPLILQADGTPYDRFQFNRDFRAVRTSILDAHPAAATKTFQDLRDTAVTRLALADCSMAQIAAITGHSLVSITSIIKHYLVLQPEMADSAIAKLSHWLEHQEIAV